MEPWEIHWHKRLHKQVPRFHLLSPPSPPDSSSTNPAFRIHALSWSAVYTYLHFQEELNISQTLAQNSYPARFIQHHSQSHMTALRKTKNHHNTIREEYLKGQQTNPDPLGIRTTFHPTNTLHQLLVHPKEQVTKLDRSSLMYHIPCKNCPPAYIGQTGRTLSQ